MGVLRKNITQSNIWSLHEDRSNLKSQPESDLVSEVLTTIVCQKQVRDHIHTCLSVNLLFFGNVHLYFKDAFALQKKYIHASVLNNLFTSYVGDVPDFIQAYNKKLSFEFYFF